MALVEARRVAERAATALRESYERRSQQAVGVDVPTWTGRSGAAGGPARFGGVSRFGGGRGAPAGGGRGRGGAMAGRGGSYFSASTPDAGNVTGSASLLEQVRSRKSEQQASTPEGTASQLAARLCAFLQARTGRCSSQQLVAHFKADCANPALFKEMLKQVATKDTAGVWVLKGSFEPGET